MSQVFNDGSIASAELMDLQDKYESLRLKLVIAKEGLEFYSKFDNGCCTQDECNFGCLDGGSTARETLSKINGEEGKK